MVDLFLRCLDPRREGGPLYRHATSEGCNHQAGPSHPSEECLQSNEMKMRMFSLSKGQRQQPPNSAASVRGAPASSAVAAAPA
ncbi:unnamed protein product, partial [Ascophyllum nodosum]